MGVTLQRSGVPRVSFPGQIDQARPARAGDLIATIKDCTPVFFEEPVDGIISEDRLGLDAIYIQAKRWEGTVGRPEIMKFAGALAGQRASKGVFISTPSYKREAREYASQSQSRSQ